MDNDELIAWIIAIIGSVSFYIFFYIMAHIIK